MKTLLQNKLLWIVGSVLVVAVYVFVQSFGQQPGGESPTPSSPTVGGTACTMEAKICPDGSAVGRSGPNCEFAACPGEGEANSMESHAIPELDLTFSAPAELEFTSDVQNDQSGNVSLVTLYLQRGAGSQAEYYQLYGIYQPSEVSVQMLEELKSDFNDGVTNIQVGGRPAITGQIKGERNRFATYVVLEGGLLRLLTADPTPSNKALTDQILETMQIGE